MSQVQAPADKRFRRAHVKPARRRRWHGVARRATLYGLLLAGALYAAYRGSEVVTQARMLQIDRLVVTGNTRVPSALVLEALDGLKGQNLVWTDLDEWRAAMRPNTKTCFLETPTNPTLNVLDIAEIAKIAHGVGATLVVDNVFSTPLWQSPLSLGADCVVYSTTKHIDGQGRCLGGVILASEKFIADNVQTFLRQTGPSMSPFNAWVMLKGMETLGVRVRQQTDTAAKVANALDKHPKVSRLLYPGRPDHPQAKVIAKQMKGGSTLVAFEVAGGKAGAFKFQDALKLVRISNNLGDAKSLITHPATTTHQRLKPEQRAELGISDGMVRLSCGLEHPDDLIDDVLNALKAI